MSEEWMKAAVWGLVTLAMLIVLWSSWRTYRADQAKLQKLQDQGEVQRLREALPYLRNAVAEASASGVAQLAVVSTKPDGSGKLVCKFECVEFMADLAAVVGAGPQTEDDDARAEARKFLQRNGIASTGQEV